MKGLLKFLSKNCMKGKKVEKKNKFSATRLRLLESPITSGVLVTSEEPHNV